MRLCVNSKAMQVKVQREKESCNGTIVTKVEQWKKIVTVELLGLGEMRAWGGWTQSKEALITITTVWDMSRGQCVCVLISKLVLLEGECWVFMSALVFLSLSFCFFLIAQGRSILCNQRQWPDLRLFWHLNFLTKLRCELYFYFTIIGLISA